MKLHRFTDVGVAKARAFLAAVKASILVAIGTRATFQSA